MTDEIQDDLPTSHLTTRRKVTLWVSVGVVAAGAVAAGLVSQGGSHAAVASTNVTSAAQTAASSAAPAPSGSAAPKPSGTTGKGKGRGGFGGPGFAGGFGAPGGLGFGRTLHSEATVAKPGGSTEIVDTQAGKITAISGATVTVTSSDKVAFSYTVTSATRVLVISTPAAGSSTKPSINQSINPEGTVSDLKVGDTVEVTATRVGDVRTATSLTDGLPTTAASGVRPQFGGSGGGPGGGFGRGPGGAGHPGGPVGSATPSPSASPAAGTGTAST